VVGGVIADELVQLRQAGVSAIELDRAKTIYEGSLARNFETVMSVASIIGIEELLYRIEPFPDAVARVRAVRADEVRQVAEETLAPDGLVVAAVGRHLSDVRPSE
jgi:predicted Zn-dependent peptidase